MAFIAATVQGLIVGVLSTAVSGYPLPPQPVEVAITVDAAEVAMGRSVFLDVQANYPDGTPAANCLVLPYVDYHRWGAHELTDENGHARIILPLPNPGSARIEVRAVARVFDTYWIWVPDTAVKTAWLMRRFSVEDTVLEADLRVSADKQCSVYLNGHLVGKSETVKHQKVFDNVAALLRQGENLLAIEARSERRLAGIAAQLRLQTKSEEYFVVSDRQWQCWDKAPPSWPGQPTTPGLDVRVVARLRDEVVAPEDGFELQQWPGSFRRDDLLVGRLLPDGEVVSNAVEVKVHPRRIDSRRDPDHLIGMQWGSYFFHEMFNWNTSHAVPLVGFYESHNPDVIRQHALWLMDIGVDFILADWPHYIAPDSNGRQRWRNRSQMANGQIHTTEATLEVYAELRDNGYPVPKLVIMPYLQNGPPNSTETVNEQLQWLYDYFIRNPRFKDLWLMHDGKPLVVILYTVGFPVEQMPGPPIDDTHFTLRFMGTQFQVSKMHEHGYWSWMDGSAEPVVTYRDGQAEAVTPTPAYFTLDFDARGGWCGSLAAGRRNGTTFVRSFKPALEHRPRYVLLHQWNEFAGQPEGYPIGGIIYGDSYSVELSDDLEPVSLTSSGYRGDNGGWGLFFCNLAQALVDLYKQDRATTTVMAVYPPDYGGVVTAGKLQVNWQILGKEPDSYTVLLDNDIKAKGLLKQSYVLDIANISKGSHVLTVVAEGAVTRYMLGREKQDIRLARPIPLKVKVPFVVISGSAAGRIFP